MAPVLFGRGTFATIAENAKKLGMTRVFLITDKGIPETSPVTNAKKMLEDAGLSAVGWNGVQPDAPEQVIKDAAAIARRERVDGVIGIGGGSSLDTAKLVSVVTVNGDEVLKGPTLVENLMAVLTGQKTERDLYPKKPLPLLLISTTAGTGAESTYVAVVSSIDLDIKVGLVRAGDFAIVDPSLTDTAPPIVTAFTGLDAFSHANEALTDEKNTAHADLLAYEAMRLIAKWLPIAVKDGANNEARDNLALASNFAGISFSESGVHIGHSAAHALGHKYHLPHGMCCAWATPAVIEFVAKDYPEKTKKIGAAMGIDVKSDDPKVIGKTVADAVRALMKDVKLPSPKEKGLTKEQVTSLKPLIYKEPLCETYDGVVTEQDVVTLLDTIYDRF
ncbi:MAG: iron-containing alcohol dehydrogenase [Synergistaceae bacterium]|nr:iron-containing alcohol dehydrogenase [Synergistaceae bacterium]